MAQQYGTVEKKAIVSGTDMGWPVALEKRVLASRSLHYQCNQKDPQHVTHKDAVYPPITYHTALEPTAPAHQHGVPTRAPVRGCQPGLTQESGYAVCQKGAWILKCLKRGQPRTEVKGGTGGGAMSPSGGLG